MQKWSYFAMGIMAGLILVLGWALLSMNHNNHAYAAMQGVDNNGKYALAVGASTSGLNDMLWLLHEHPPHPGLKIREEDSKILKPNRISLCLYRITKSGEKMQLVSARDVAYDVELMDFNQEKPTVREILETLGKSIKKE